MKKLLFPLFMLAMIVTSCEKDPDMNKLDSDYSVYTDYDNSAHFNEFPPITCQIAFWFRTTA